MADFGLYTYQQEVVERALKRENVIIWLPTGGGKTRAAVYVAKKHLETTPNAKVMVLVNKVHLVDQHYNKEFDPKLGLHYAVRKVSGESDEKDFFGLVVQESDVVICTAQILYNALINKEEARHVELSDITLLIIDECHHTHKEEAYNKVMRLYVEKKLKGEKPLPQILGLTASPGTGGAKTLDKAVEHVLEDPFGDHLISMMNIIHSRMNLPPDFRLKECGTQEYEADVVNLEQRGVQEKNRLLAQCALHLRQYNDALLINDTLRMIDAYRSLEEYYSKKRTNPIDGTDTFLLGLFEENQVELKNLAMDSRFENPKMDELQSTLLEQFGSGVPARAIIFTKTRKSTHYLKDWVLKNRALQEAGIKADILIGAGNGITYMTQNEQAETIENFRMGSLNLLISTSVAEEGLDIPECNLVVRYGLLTNEIAQQQAKGRARAKNSQYAVVAQAGGHEDCRERINESLEELTGQAIDRVQTMTCQDFCTKITQLREMVVTCTKIEQRRQAEKRSRNTASSIQLLCRNCFTPVASGSDIKLVENMYVNVNPAFKKHYTFGDQLTLERSFKDWEPMHTISCEICNQKWGNEIKYKKCAILPNLAIKNFVLESPGQERLPVKKWKDVPFTVEDFNFKEYCQENFPDMLD
ncbi:ATP-dependent RNA helicase DHX58-like isoform X3 [Pelmatolapia mariae]|uniref:ATP-dependent RNA helicase DHX58-like isoform X3 n=1 Tax=Pelmatolapia mariae TaxID=158779 RepID=UPI002FE6641B